MRKGKKKEKQRTKKEKRTRRLTSPPTCPSETRSGKQIKVQAGFYDITVKTAPNNAAANTTAGAQSAAAPLELPVAVGPEAEPLRDPEALAPLPPWLEPVPPAAPLEVAVGRAAKS